MSRNGFRRHEEPGIGHAERLEDALGEHLVQTLCFDALLWSPIRVWCGFVDRNGAPLTVVRWAATQLVMSSVP
jgi:hypothetical protein